MAELSSPPSLAADGFTTLRRRGVLLSLTLSFSVGTVASTIYVPSIPAIARALDTSIARVQFTFVSYLLAYAISMLVLGPLSDRLGRRRTVLYGLALSAVSSLACAASPSIDFLIAARVLQGIGACAGMVVGRAITRDIWGPAAAAQVIAGRGIAATLMQVGAPVVGGYLQMSFGWRANFAAVAILACLAIVLMIRFVPDHGAASTASANGPRMLASYRTLIGTRRFLGYALAAAGAHAGSHIFAAGAPAVLIGSFGVSPAQYGYYAALPPLGFLVGSFVSNRLTRPPRPQRPDHDWRNGADPGRFGHGGLGGAALDRTLHRRRADDLCLLRQWVDHPQRRCRKSRGRFPNCRRRLGSRQLFPDHRSRRLHGRAIARAEREPAYAGDRHRICRAAMRHRLRLSSAA